MAVPRPIVPVLCAAALAGAIVVVLGVVGSAESSGRASLTEAARSFTKALTAPGARPADLVRFLAPGASPSDPRVHRALEALRQALQGGSMVAEVRTLGANRGETDVVVMPSLRPGAGPSELTFQWTRSAGGAWVLDPVAR